MIVAALQTEAAASVEYVPIFDAIARLHERNATEYCVVTQPDHAQLSGAFAAAFDRERFPYIDDEILQGIAVHDSGWAPFDGRAPHPILPKVLPDGRLQSFLTTPPEIFLRAWTGSIDQAEDVGDAAGAMVSRHFGRLAQYRLQNVQDGPEDVSRIHGFLRAEASRQERLDGGNQQNGLLKVLQFCDLISLYVCCGVRESVLFPPLFEGELVRVRRSGGTTVVQNSPLKGQVEAKCPAFRWLAGANELIASPIAVKVVPV